MSATVTRRLKWQYLPAPRIIYLPRRPPRRRQKQPNKNAVPAIPSSGGDRRGKLEALFDRERTFSKAGVPVVLLEYDEMRRERVGDGGAAEEEAEKWRFQAEMLRAECNFLRKEREIALKKLEKTRTQMERTLRSTVQTLITGRNKISDGETLRAVLEEEVQELVEKLEKLQRRSRGARDHSESRSCSNFDKQACLVQRKLERIGGTTTKESCASRKYNDVQLEVLKKKMEGLSKGMLLETMEDEYRSLLSTANSSASTSKRTEAPDMPCTASFVFQETMSLDGSACTGRCKVIVRRIVEQVRAETEQWSQMQEMLGQVREEMEDMRASRDFWEDRARGSDSAIKTLSSSVREWKEKALGQERKARELEAKTSRLEREIEKWSSTKAKVLPPISRQETEKRVLICRLKENKRTSNNDNPSKQNEAFRDERRKSFSGAVLAPKTSPFRDISNFV